MKTKSLLRDFKVALYLGGGMKGKYEKGFTLVELIVTIVIIGILTAAAFTTFKNYSDASKAASCRENQINIEAMQVFFYLDKLESSGTGRYATSIGELNLYFPEGRQPKCPSTGTYEFLANGAVNCTEPEHHR